MKRLTVLYVTGVGDKRVRGQQLAIGTWRLWGVRPKLVQMNWTNNETWEYKQQRLLEQIDQLTEAGKPVALVGASAGAAAVITTYALRKRQLLGCVLLAGKIHHPDTIGEVYRRENPALLSCVQACEQSLNSLDRADRKRIVSRYSLFDTVVPRRDSHVEGAQNRQLHTYGHALTIGVQLLFGAPVFLRSLKRLARLVPTTR